MLTDFIRPRLPFVAAVTVAALLAAAMPAAAGNHAL